MFDCVAVQLYAEKPTKVHPSTFRPDTEQLERSKEYLTAISTCSGREQARVPVTASREIGKHPTPVLKHHPAFHYPKTKCQITAYADAYCIFSGGTSSFAKVKGPVPEHGKK